jgi:hypothetical protein
MPTLNVRTIGMSYLIDGLDPEAIDPIALSEGLKGLHGIAVATLKVPQTADPADDPGNSAIEAILIDRRATDWDALCDWLESWVMAQGATYTSWVTNPLSQEASATLHFHTS